MPAEAPRAVVRATQRSRCGPADSARTGALPTATTVPSREPFRATAGSRSGQTAAAGPRPSSDKSRSIRSTAAAAEDALFVVDGDDDGSAGSSWAGMVTGQLSRVLKGSGGATQRVRDVASQHQSLPWIIRPAAIATAGMNLVRFQKHKLGERVTYGACIDDVGGTRSRAAQRTGCRRGCRDATAHRPLATGDQAIHIGQLWAALRTTRRGEPQPGGAIDGQRCCTRRSRDGYFSSGTCNDSHCAAGRVATLR